MKINVEIHLMCIPAHVGIELHDKADRLARLEARNIHLEIYPEPAFVTFDNALNRASAYDTPLDGATVKVVITTVNKT